MRARISFVARGNLVIGAGPGCFSRALRRLGVGGVMLVGLVAAGITGGYVAQQRITSATDGAFRDGVSALARGLAAGVQYDLAQREANSDVRSNLN